VSVPGCFGDEWVSSVGFWEESLFLFLGGRGRGRGSVRASTAESVSQDDTHFQTAPFFMLYIMY
jgi:hypothetical protein